MAVIGASTKPRKLSFGIMRNLVNSTYTGGVYPVNPGDHNVDYWQAQMTSTFNGTRRDGREFSNDWN